MKQEEILDLIRNYIKKEIIKDEDITIEINEPLVTAGLIDSFSLVKISVFLERKFNVKIDNTKVNIQNMNTLQDMINLIKS